MLSELLELCTAALALDVTAVDELARDEGSSDLSVATDETDVFAVDEAGSMGWVSKVLAPEPAPPPQALKKPQMNSDETPFFNAR